MNTTSFTPEEVIPYAGILIIVLSVLARNYFKAYWTVWSPLTIVVIVYGYYCVIGPYQAITSGSTYDRLINMRPFYVSAFWGAFISLLSLLLAFGLNRKLSAHRPGMAVHPEDEYLFIYGKRIFLLGFILFTISTGGNVASLINPLNAEAVETQGGSIANYFGLSLNFTIPGITLLFTYFLRTRKGLMWVIIPAFITLGIFITLGFRYRIVLLVGSMAISYYLTQKKRPNLIVLVPLIFVFVVLMGVINVSRKYGHGLDVKKLRGKDSQAFYNSGLKESLIFQTSGAVINMVPEKYPYAGWRPIISTLFFPIPSAIYKEKDSGKYLFDMLDAIYGKKYSKGAAMMSYGEYYLAFGWIGIAIGSFLLGWVYKNLWLWYLAQSSNPYVTCAYAVTVSYLYVILSRGYLPQVTMLFFFSVFPVFVVTRLATKQALIKKSAASEV